MEFLLPKLSLNLKRQTDIEFNILFYDIDNYVDVNSITKSSLTAPFTSPLHTWVRLLWCECIRPISNLAEKARRIFQREGVSLRVRKRNKRGLVNPAQQTRLARFVKLLHIITTAAKRNAFSVKVKTFPREVMYGMFTNKWLVKLKNVGISPLQLRPFCKIPRHPPPSTMHTISKREGGRMCWVPPASPIHARSYVCMCGWNGHFVGFESRRGGLCYAGNLISFSAKRKLGL